MKPVACLYVAYLIAVSALLALVMNVAIIGSMPDPGPAETYLCGMAHTIEHGQMAVDDSFWRQEKEWHYITSLDYYGAGSSGATFTRFNEKEMNIVATAFKTAKTYASLDHGSMAGKMNMIAAWQVADTTSLCSYATTLPWTTS